MTITPPHQLIKLDRLSLACLRHLSYSEEARRQANSHWQFSSRLSFTYNKREEVMNEGGKGAEEEDEAWLSYIVRHERPVLPEDCRSLYLSWPWSAALTAAPAPPPPAGKTPRSRLSSTWPCALQREREREGVVRKRERFGVFLNSTQSFLLSPHSSRERQSSSVTLRFSANTPF